MKNKNKNTVFWLCVLLVFTGTFLDVLKHMLLGSDFTMHADSADLLLMEGLHAFVNFTYDPATIWQVNPLWHLCYAAGRFLGMPQTLSASLVAATANTVCFEITCFQKMRSGQT